MGSASLEDFVQSLAKPRKIVILVKAGRPDGRGDRQLAAAAREDDIVIDGGNALWTDTIRREKL